MNYSELEPGGKFAEIVYAHFDQEEVFYVIDGEVAFEVRTDGQKRDRDRQAEQGDPVHPERVPTRSQRVGRAGAYARVR